MQRLLGFLLILILSISYTNSASAEYIFIEKFGMNIEMPYESSVFFDEHIIHEDALRYLIMEAYIFETLLEERDIIFDVHAMLSNGSILVFHEDSLSSYPDLNNIAIDDARPYMFDMLNDPKLMVNQLNNGEQSKIVLANQVPFLYSETEGTINNKKIKNIVCTTKIDGNGITILFLLSEDDGSYESVVEKVINSIWFEGVVPVWDLAKEENDAISVEYDEFVLNLPTGWKEVSNIVPDYTNTISFGFRNRSFMISRIDLWGMMKDDIKKIYMANGIYRNDYDMELLASLSPSKRDFLQELTKNLESKMSYSREIPWLLYAGFHRGEIPPGIPQEIYSEPVESVAVSDEGKLDYIAGRMFVILEQVNSCKGENEQYLIHSRNFSTLYEIIENGYIYLFYTSYEPTQAARDEMRSLLEHIIWHD